MPRFTTIPLKPSSEQNDEDILVFLSEKELSCCNKLQLSNPHISATEWCKPLIFQTYIIWSNRNHSLKYQRYTTFGCKDIEIRKFEFVAKTQFLFFKTISITQKISKCRLAIPQFTEWKGERKISLNFIQWFSQM